MAIYSYRSPYYKTGIVNDYLDVLSFTNIPSQSDDILFEVTSLYQYRPDLLAYDLYKDTKLWWVFAIRNKDLIKDPIFDLKAGVKIYLPKLSVLNQVLSR